MKSTVESPVANRSFDDSSISSPTTTPNLSFLPPNVQDASARKSQPGVREIMKLERARKQTQALEAKKQLEAEKRMTPASYAANVRIKFRDFLETAPVKKQFLKDTIIFYVGGDYSVASRTTREKMDFVRLHCAYSSTQLTV